MTLTTPLNTSKVSTLLIFPSTISSHKRTPAHTACGIPSNTSTYLNSRRCALSLQHQSLLSPTLIDKFLRSLPACAHLAWILFLSCASAGMRTMVSLLSFQRETLNLRQRTPCRRFTAPLAETSHLGRETIETHSLSLSEFKHST
jgi:hypothetical protein